MYPYISKEVKYMKVFFIPNTDFTNQNQTFTTKIVKYIYIYILIYIYIYIY